MFGYLLKPCTLTKKMFDDLGVEKGTGLSFEQFNDFDYLFENKVESDFHEYNGVRNSYVPSFIGHLGCKKIGMNWKNFKIESYYDKIFLIGCPYDWSLDKVSGKVIWTGETLYYKVGCNHNYKELSVQECRTLGIEHFGNCWHVTKCVKCGNVTSYDSSG